MPFLFFFFLLINFSDEEELREEIQVYFEELKINPNYDSKEKLSLFPFLNEIDIEKIIKERERGYFKDLNDFKKRTNIFLPDSIFKNYFDFEIKKRGISFLSYIKKDEQTITRLSFYQDKNFLNFFLSKKFKEYEIYRFSYSFKGKRDLDFIIGDYFLNTGCGLIYGTSSIFFDFSKNFPEIPETRFIPSSSYNRGLKGISLSYKNLLLYFSSKKLKEEAESFEFKEEKFGSALSFKFKNLCFSSIFERNHLSKKIYYLNKKDFYQIGINFSLKYKNFILNAEYLPQNSSFFTKFSYLKNGFLIYRISENNYDFHSSFISQEGNARDEEGFSLFGRFKFFVLNNETYLLIYRKISETDYSYKFYSSLDFKNILKFDYKNTLSSYKRERFRIGIFYKNAGIKLNYLVANNEGNLSYGNSIFSSLNSGFLNFSYGIFNTQDYSSRIYFYQVEFFPYYELLPLYGNGSIISFSLNFKMKNLKIYTGMYEIIKDKNEIYIRAGFSFKNEEIL